MQILTLMPPPTHNASPDDEKEDITRAAACMGVTSFPSRSYVFLFVTPGLVSSILKDSLPGGATCNAL